MNAEEFDLVLASRLARIQCVLKSKAEAYATNGDRLGNFKDAGIMNGVRPEEALWGMVSKHIVALVGFLKYMDYDTVPHGEWDEKIGDIINYMILLEALLTERRVM